MQTVSLPEHAVMDFLLHTVVHLHLRHMWACSHVTYNCCIVVDLLNTFLSCVVVQLLQQWIILTLNLS